jgi:hypothetical protein
MVQRSQISASTKKKTRRGSTDGADALLLTMIDRSCALDMTNDPNFFHETKGRAQMRARQPHSMSLLLLHVCDPNPNGVAVKEEAHGGSAGLIMLFSDDGSMDDGDESRLSLALS